MFEVHPHKKVSPGVLAYPHIILHAGSEAIIQLLGTAVVSLEKCAPYKMRGWWGGWKRLKGGAASDSAQFQEQYSVKAGVWQQNLAFHNKIQKLIKIIAFLAIKHCRNTFSVNAEILNGYLNYVTLFQRFFFSHSCEIHYRIIA